MGNDKNQLDLERLRTRLREKPRTKVGQVRQAWPYIKELFAAGHSLKDVRTWLNEIGIDIGYARLSHYVGQLRRSEIHLSQGAMLPPAAEPPSEATPAGSKPAEGLPQAVQVDPLANVLEREQRRPGFHYNADPDPKKLI